MEEVEEFIPVITDGKIADEAGNIYDLTRTIDSGVIAFLTIGIIVSIVAVLFLELRAVKRNQGKIVPFFLGILSYVYFGVLIYGILVILINQIPGISQFSLDHEVQRLIFVMGLTAFLLVFGKMLSVHILFQKYDKIGDWLSFGAGFALGNVAPTIFNWFMTSTVMTAINEAGGLIGLVDGKSPEEVLEFAKQYENLFSLTGETIMYQSLFIVLITAFNVFSISFMYAIKKKQMSFYMNWAIFGVHFVLLVLNALSTYGHMNSILAFAIQVLIVVISLRYIFATCKYELGDLLRPTAPQFDRKKYKPQMMKAKNVKKKK